MGISELSVAKKYTANTCTVLTEYHGNKLLLHNIKEEILLAISGRMNKQVTQ